MTLKYMNELYGICCDLKPEQTELYVTWVGHVWTCSGRKPTASDGQPVDTDEADPKNPVCSDEQIDIDESIQDPV